MPTISLCMIARNEEAWIAQAIQSVLPIVSEVIVVDTGSTDYTVAIAEKLGARVYHMRWQDDFALTRNFSLSLARSDWILVLDSDEAIAPEDLPRLVALTCDPGRCTEFMQRHYSSDQRLMGFTSCTGVYPEWERDHGGYFESNCCRLFPNFEGLRFEGRIHELVEHSIHRIGIHRIERTNIPIHHYGHTSAVKSKKKKATLYTSLGETKAKEQTQDWKSYYELGVEHNNNGRLDESAAALRRSLELRSDYVDTWVNLGYVLNELGAWQESEEVLKKALALAPTSRDVYLNLGVCYLRSNRPRDAELAFRQSVIIAPDFVNGLGNLGQALVQQGRFSEAAICYQRALKIFPGYVSGRLLLGAAYLMARQPLLAYEQLVAVLSFDAKNLDAFILLATACEELGYLDRAAAAIENFLAFASEQAEPAHVAIIEEQTMKLTRIREALHSKTSGMSATA